MPRARQRRCASTRVFLITGVDSNERITLGKQLQKLGAVYIKTEHFQSNATHVVCGKLSRSEKFLGALALGRWVVRPDYITASLRAGEWLDEVEYEWSSLIEQGHDHILAAAAKRHRWRASMSTEKIFTDWHVAVVMSDHRRQAVYKRLLACGGASVLDLKLPAKNPGKCSEFLTYLFVDRTTVPLAQSLQDHGVLCLNADFISDCIILHPSPDPLDYILMPDNADEAPYSGTQNGPDDPSSTDLFHQMGAARTATSTVTNQAEGLDRTDADDDMLILSQCMPSSRSAGVPYAMHDNNSNGGIFEVSGVDSTSTSDGWEDSREERRPVTSGDNGIISCEKSGRPVSCAAAGDGRRQIPSSSKLSCGSTQPCPVVITAVKMPSLSATTSTVVTSSLPSSSSSTVITTSQSSVSTVVTLSQSSSSVSKAVTLSQPSSLVSRAVKSSLSSSSSSTTVNSPAKAKEGNELRGCSVTVADVSRELEKMKKNVKKGPFKRSLVSTTPGKVQTSLQHWFLPSGKENAHKTKTADGTAKSEREKSSGYEVQPQNACTSEKQSLQTLRKTVSPKDGPIKRLSQKIHDNSIPHKRLKKSLETCRQKILNSAPGGGSGQGKRKAATSLSSGEKSMKLPTSENAQTMKPDKESSAVSAPVQECEFGSEFLATSRPDNGPHENLSCVSQSKSIEKSEQVEKPEDSHCAGTKASAGSETTKDENSTEKQRTDLSEIKRGEKSIENQCKVSGRTDSASRDKTVAPCTYSPRKDLVKVTKSSDLKKRHTGSSSSNGVLSTRSINKPRCTKRRTHTALIKNYIEVLRKKKKVEDTVPISVEQASLEKFSETERTQQSQAKRRKTVRGLSIRTEQMAGVTHSDQNSTVMDNQTSCKNDSAQTSGSLMCQRMQNGNETGYEKQQKEVNSLITPNSNVQPLPDTVQESAAEFQTSPEPGSSGAKWLFPCTRWRLSHAPLPKQFDLTSHRGSSLETLGSKGQVPGSLGLMISSCLDENYLQSGVAMAVSAANSCPSVDLVRQMVAVVKEAGSPTLVNQANAVVMSWLDQFPPVTPNLRSIYEEALGLDKWESFRKILEDAVSESETEMKGACLENDGGCGAQRVLRIVMVALEKNFLHFSHNASRQSRNNCLIVRCLWSPSYQVYPNGRTRSLMRFLERALKHHGSVWACWGELLNLVSMATQCCYLADKDWQWSAEGYVDRCSSPMVQEFTQAITGGGVDSAERLQQVLSGLSPPWLLRQVVATLLEDYDDYLIPGGFSSDPITLKTIVSKYFFLLPKLSAVDKSENPSHRKKLKADAEEKDENKAITVDPKLTADKINKKNHKGESMLHRAAIRNSISLLKQILTVPGVDVNSQDYAGWTPLHEACNHGNVECVRALLKFVPSATLDSFCHAGNNGKKVRKVDLHLANNEGITALHDAVLTNHISVVKLLLKYGGPSLLTAKTVEGCTAMDLAQTEEMRQVLSRDTVDSSFSQDSFSQDLGSPRRESVPSSFMYQEVTGSSDGNTHFSASLGEGRKFLTLLTLLLRSHLQAQQQHRQQPQLQHERTDSQREQTEPERCGEDLKFYLQCFERHIRKITTEDVFHCLRVPMCVLEALLTEWG